MSILAKSDRIGLRKAMKRSLLEQINESKLSPKDTLKAKNYVVNEASYQELLNLTYNPNREEGLLSITEMEQVSLDNYKQYLVENVQGSAFEAIEKKVLGEGTKAPVASKKKKADK